MLDGMNIRGIVGLGVTSKFMVASARHRNDDHVSFLVSLDGRTWDEAEFSERGDAPMTEYSVTVLESSKHSLHVDVLKEKDDLAGDFYVSNSNGTYFRKSLEHTHRNKMGFVDIEKLENVEGILIANVISNYDEYSRTAGEKNVRTVISYDDGRHWKYLSVDDSKCKGDESCGLNLHSVLDKSNVGRIFSSPAPGVIAGIGNLGTKLKDYEDGDMFVSHDSGLTWVKSKSDAHKYEFGDSGNVMVAIQDEGVVNKMSYSVDRGLTWNDFDLGVDIRAKYLFTTQDSTSMNFVLIGKPSSSKDKTMVIAIDFDGLYKQQCKLKEDGSGDYEKWYARWEDRSNPSCIMGHKQYFWRKKLDAKCFVGNVFNEQKALEEICECSEDDFECDYNYFRTSEGFCVPSPALVEDKSACDSNPEGTYEGVSGFRLIPGNNCKKVPNGVDLEKKVMKSCVDGSIVKSAQPPKSDKPKNTEDDKKPASKEVANKLTEFNGKIIDYFYLKAEKPEEADETIILRTDSNQVFISHDHGGKWERIFEDKEIIAIYANPYFPNACYLITTKEEVVFTLDRGHNWKSFRTPAKRNNAGIPYITFSKKFVNWFIWTGEIGCENPFSATCHTVAYYTKSHGERWNKLQENVKRCVYVNELEEAKSERIIYCERVYTDSQGKVKNMLVSSYDFFNTQKVLFDDIIGFALEHEFAVVATLAENAESLTAYVSVDAENFSQVRFPLNYQIGKQQAYTILESITHSIFLHLTTSARPGSEYGTILKSNSNGTDYISSLDYVNRNQQGYVDFEKVIGLEGVAIVNTVENPNEAFEGSKKKLKSRITHNDGGEWSYIFPPLKDSEGNKYKCPGASLNKCSLNLHGYTERLDYRDTFSSQSAVGMMLAVGNVGQYLTPLHDGNTFFTKDGGITWKEVKKGFYMWEFGDQGSIIVIVNGKDNTNVVHYSLDEGDTWVEYKFSEELVRIEDIATVPSDSSRKFLLIGRPRLSRGEKSITIQLDFSGMFERQCELSLTDPDHDDFELWTPSHPFQQDNCLFGHETQYYRKIKGRDCYIGRSLLKPYEIIRNCSCTRRDYECDFNYERGSDGACRLVPGYSPPDHSSICKEMPGTIEYWEPTGYRKIPLSTCEGGQTLDKIEAKPCPGKEKEFNQKHRGLHGFGLFMVIVLPIGMAGVIGYIMWDHFSKRYGQIRLGEDDEDQNVIVRSLVISVAAVIAVLSVIPDFFQSAYRTIKSKFKRSRRFTTRGSLSRGRNDYSIVAAAEDELLGPDDEDIGLDEDDEISASMSDAEEIEINP